MRADSSEPGPVVFPALPLGPSFSSPALSVVIGMFITARSEEGA